VNRVVVYMKSGKFFIADMADELLEELETAIELGKTAIQGHLFKLNNKITVSIRHVEAISKEKENVE
jgi:hypothetical protein